MSAVDRLINIELFGAGELLGTKIDYSPNDADREWVARELGDVPYDRIVSQSCHDNPMSWAEFRCVVPVESSGR